MNSYIPKCESCSKEFDPDEFLAGENYNKNGTFRFVFSKIGDELHTKNITEWEREHSRIPQYKYLMVCADCYLLYKDKSEEAFSESYSSFQHKVSSS